MVEDCEEKEKAGREMDTSRKQKTKGNEESIEDFELACMVW